nr:hypothetical protein [Tanacetum cinerariifolium]
MNFINNIVDGNLTMAKKVSKEINDQIILRSPCNMVSFIRRLQVEDFTDRTQNVARAVGKLEVEEIHDCIKLTIQSLGSFMNG